MNTVGYLPCTIIQEMRFCQCKKHDRKHIVIAFSSPNLRGIQIRTLLSNDIPLCYFNPMIRIFAASLGLLITAHAQVPTMKALWSHPIPRYLPLTLTADQSGRPYLYVAQKSGGLLILQEKGNKPPTAIATTPIKLLGNMGVGHCVHRGKYLYLGLGDFFGRKKYAGLAIIDISSPTKPKVKSIWKSPQPLHGVSTILIRGKHAYLCAMSAGLITLDISNPNKIRYLSTYQPDVHFPKKNPGRVAHPNARGGVIKGNLLFLAYDAGGIRVLDISNPSKPREISRYINAGMAGKQQAYNNVLIHKNTLYAAIDYAGIEILNIASPKNIRQIGWWNPWNANTPQNIWFNSPGHTNELALRKNILYISAGNREALALDVSRPAKPRLAKHFGAPKNQQGVWGIHLGKTKLYLTYIRTMIPFRGTWSGIKAVQP